MRSFAFFFLLLFAGLNSSYAQAYGDGSVQTSQGESVRQAEVVVNHADDYDNATYYTDMNGEFSFDGLYVGVDDSEQVPDGIELWPTNGQSRMVRYERPQERDGSARVFDMSGRLVKTVPVNDTDPVVNVTVDGSGLSPGVYLFNDGQHTARFIHNPQGPMAQERSNPVLKNGLDRDVYNFLIRPQDGESNVLFDETSFNENLDNGYNSISFDIVPTAFRHQLNGSVNVNGAQVLFENGEGDLQATVTNGTYQTPSDYYDSREESFDVTVSADGYQTLEETVNANWNTGDGDSFNFTLEEEFPEYYENEETYFVIRRQNYPYDGNNTVITHAKVVFEGINIDYSDSITNQGTELFMFNNLRIPVNDGGEPSVAQYKRTTTPIDTTYTQMFLEEVDTVEVTMDSWQLPDAEPLQYPQNVRMTGSVEDLITEESLAGKHVIARDPTSGDVLAEAVTQADGSYSLNNRIEAGTTFEWAVGHYNGEDSEHLSTQGHTYTIADQIVGPNDTTAIVNRMLVPETALIPATPNDPNYNETLPVDPEKLSDLIRGPPFQTSYIADLEEALGRKVNFYIGDLTEDGKEDVKDIVREGDSVFYGIPWETSLSADVRPFNIVDEMYDSDEMLPNPGDYHPVDNYHPGDLGFAIHDAGNETSSVSREAINGKQYPERSVVGGDIWINMSDIAGNLKELYGRSEDRQDVTGYDSFMNLDASYPTLFDRTNIYLIHANEAQRWTFDEDGNSNAYYPLDKVGYTID